MVGGTIDAHKEKKPFSWRLSERKQSRVVLELHPKSCWRGSPTNPRCHVREGKVLGSWGSDEDCSNGHHICILISTNCSFFFYSSTLPIQKVHPFSQPSTSKKQHTPTHSSSSSSCCCCCPRCGGCCGTIVQNHRSRGGHSRIRSFLYCFRWPIRYHYWGKTVKQLPT